MKHKLLILLFGVLAFSVAWIAMSWAGPASWRYRGDVKRSQPYIAQIDAFIRANGRSPSDAEAEQVWRTAGLDVSPSCPCYDKRGEKAYVVWVGGDLGISYIYDSGSRRWSEEG